MTDTHDDAAPGTPVEYPWPPASGASWTTPAATPPPAGSGAPPASSGEPPAGRPPDLPVPEPWQPASTPPPSRTKVWMVVVVVVALIAGFGITTLALEATDSGSRARGSAAAPTPPTTMPTTPSTTPGSTLPPDPAEPLLGRLNVQQPDVPATFTVVLQPHGTDAAGTATLDLCNGTYPSEKLRTARRQVIVADAQGNGVLSTEAVLYRSPAATAQAFTELRNVTAHCPSKPVASPVGEPTVQTKFFAAPDTTWPQTAGVERLAFDLDTVDASGQHFRSAAVYLRRGRVLLGIYFSPANGTATTVQHKTSTADIVGIFAARMADLPAHAING